LHKPSPRGCVTTYIPFPTPATIASSSSSEEKHGLYLCQEGGKKMDQQLHLVKLWGIHFFFILGDEFSRKQVSPPISIFAQIQTKRGTFLSSVIGNEFFKVFVVL
jgi:hypothetical protein